MNKDVNQILAALRTEASDAEYRKNLLKQVEDLWNRDPKFRSSIRGMIKNSEVKDTRGKKSLVDSKLIESALKLGGKLGFTKEEMSDLLAQGVEPEAIKQALHRKQKGKSQTT